MEDRKFVRIALMIYVILMFTVVISVLITFILGYNEYISLIISIPISILVVKKFSEKRKK